MSDLSPESAAVAAERYTKARCGLLSTPELGQYIDGMFDQVSALLEENAGWRQVVEDLRGALYKMANELQRVRQQKDDAVAAASYTRTHP